MSSRIQRSLRLSAIMLLATVLVVQIAACIWALDQFHSIWTARNPGIVGPMGHFEDLPLVRESGGVRVVGILPGTAAERVGLLEGDLLTRVGDSNLVVDPRAYFRNLVLTGPVDSLRVAWLHGDVEREAWLHPRPFGARTWSFPVGGTSLELTVRQFLWIQYGSVLLMLVLLLVVGLGIGLLRSGETAPFMISAMFLCMGIFFFLETGDVAMIVALPPSLYLALTLASTASIGGLIYLVVLSLSAFPRQTRLGGWILGRKRGLAAICILISAAQLTTRWPGESLPLSWGRAAAGIFSRSAVLALILLAALVLLAAQRWSADGRSRKRLGIIEAGLGAGIFAGLWHLFWPDDFFWRLLGGRGTVLPLLAWFLNRFTPILIGCFLPLSFAYAVLARRVFGIQVILRRGLQHLFLSKSILLVEGLLVFLLLGEFIRLGQARIGGSVPAIAAISGMATLGLLWGASKVNRPLMRRIDLKFFREQHTVRSVLVSLGEELSTVHDSDKIFELSGLSIARALHPLRLAFFLLEPEAAQATLAWDSSGPGNGLGDLPREDQVQAPPWDEARSRLAAGAAWMKIPLEKSGDARTGPPAFELLVALRNVNGLAGWIALALKRSEEPYSREDQELLETLSRHIGLALENAKLLAVAKREAEQARELQIARRVQEDLFPRDIPRIPGWGFATLCRPAREVGGDYHDLFLVDEDHLAIALGDVSGKGLGPSLLMASVHAIIRNRLTDPGVDLARLISEINRHLIRSSGISMFVTLFIGLLDLRDGRLDYVNGGHDAPILLKGGAPDPVRLREGGPLVGILPEAAYVSGTAGVDPGGALVLYSDGISEAFAQDDEMYSEERLLQSFLRNASAPAPGILEALLADLNEFTAGREQADDISIIVAQRAPRHG